MIIVLFSLGFLVEHTASVTRLHYTLFSAVFTTYRHDHSQPFIHSSHHLLHITLTSNTQLIVSPLDPTRRPDLVCDVPHRPSQSMPNPIHLHLSLHICWAVGSCLVGSLTASQSEFLVAYSYYSRHPSDLHYRVSE
ncbi:unnamed protein product [Heterobilharzia americana]|nr:unnamed protein product [Heterobilharzia americana]CAH8518767.1 unnamed protein product [Heterobilharzia americana]